MNAATLDQQNIFETVVRDMLCYPEAKLAPRIFVRRHTLTEKTCREVLSPPGHTPCPLISRFLEGDHPVIDITSHFQLNPNWKPTEGHEYVELDFDRYSCYPCNKQARIEFAFTEPVVNGDASVFYAVSDRGFLSAQGFLCMFSGSFDQPREHKIIPLWQS